MATKPATQPTDAVIKNAVSQVLEHKRNVRDVAAEFKISATTLQKWIREAKPRPRLDRIYTKTGDDGTTGLGGGQRVQKDSLRIEGYGTVDELNSVIGVAVASGLNEELLAMLEPIQHDLFHLGSDLCMREEDKIKYKVPQIEDRHIKQLEGFIDQLQKSLKPLDNFILPGGSVGAANLHVARCVCRRAERRVQTLTREEPIGRFCIPYLNRLSDLLFVMARYENLKKQGKDVLWKQHG
jgi:cob(I)alamin adenosyltransferase